MYEPIHSFAPSNSNPTSIIPFRTTLESRIKSVWITKMSSASRAWIVASSVGVVEALKDQGVCRWNYALRSAQQQLKSQARSISQAKKLSSSSSAMVSSRLENEKAKQSEESLRTVMYLSCWGPNWSRSEATKENFVISSKFRASPQAKTGDGMGWVFWCHLG